MSIFGNVTTYPILCKADMGFLSDFNCKAGLQLIYHVTLPDAVAIT